MKECEPDMEWVVGELDALIQAHRRLVAASVRDGVPPEQAVESAIQQLGTAAPPGVRAIVEAALLATLA